MYPNPRNDGEHGPLGLLYSPVSELNWTELNFIWNSSHEAKERWKQDTIIK